MTDWIWQSEESGQSDSQVSSSSSTVSEAIKKTLYREQENWFLWLPVGLALGCAAYFALVVEPSWGLVVFLMLNSIGLLILSRKHTLAFVFSIFTLSIVMGFALAKINTARVAAPVIQKRMGPVLVKGRIENLSYYANGEIKILLRPLEVERLKSQNLPRRLRLKLRRSQNNIELTAGQIIKARAFIFPPPEPAYPGGFDFARKSWFEGVGGSGFFIVTPKILPENTETSFYGRAQASLARTRQNISNRLKTRLGPEMGGLAAALIVGDRAAISKTLIDTLRDAGLAHLLAISGLHMALFAGTIFWLLRALLALNATLVLRWPVKKWAAGGALAGAVFYLFISGASIATQRAFIMILIMFVAIMLDRPAITLRNIAIAAMIILVIKPVSLLSISFQMSFAATAMLVAFYQWYRRIEIFRLHSSSSPAIRGLSKLLFYFAGIAVTTLIAGLATSPFAAYYFQRVAVFSLLANVLALPLIGFIVMPAGLIALLLMPLGLDGYALSIMGGGLEMVVAIASWTALLPNAVQVVPAFSGAALLLMVFGALWICLWQTRWRILGLGVIAAGVALAPQYALPDVYISASARNIAVRGKDGLLVVAKARSEKYSVGKWLVRGGDEVSPKQAAKREGFRCDARGCIFKLKDNRLLGFAADPAAVEEDCTRVDILISRIPVRVDCQKPMVVIDKFDLWRNGAYSIRFLESAFLVNSARQQRGERPWVRKREKRKSYEPKQ
jgi:competence protein ComEC